MRALRLILVGFLFLLVVEHAPMRLMLAAAEACYYPPMQRLRMPSGTDAYWQVQDLETGLRRFGWEIKYVPDLMSDEGAYGMTMPRERLIVVDESLSWNARYVTLAHEAGHALTPARFSEGQGEAFAEGVAVVLRAGDIRDHARYLASLRADLPVLGLYWREIYHAAAALTP